MISNERPLDCRPDKIILSNNNVKLVVHSSSKVLDCGPGRGELNHSNIEVGGLADHSEVC